MSRASTNRFNKSHRRHQRGAAITEAAIMLPLYVLVLGGIVFFGQGYSLRLATQIAARHAVWQVANGVGSPSSSDIQSRFFRHADEEDEVQIKVDSEDRQDTFLSRLQLDTIFDSALRSSGLSFKIHTVEVKYRWLDSFLFPNKTSQTSAKTLLLNNQVGDQEPSVKSVRGATGEPTS